MESVAVRKSRLSDALPPSMPMRSVPPFLGASSARARPPMGPSDRPSAPAPVNSVRRSMMRLDGLDDGSAAFMVASFSGSRWTERNCGLGTGLVKQCSCLP